MKYTVTLLMALFITFVCTAQTQDSIVVDGKNMGGFLAEWKVGFFNQALLTHDGRGNTFIQMSFAPNATDAPIPGTYKLADGSKAKVKKGEQIARMNFGLKYISTDESGTVEVSYKNELFTFDLNDVTLVDKKTQEKHRISAHIVMFIAKR
jgi:hypothetical protein